MKIDWSKWEMVEVPPLEAVCEWVIARYVSVAYGCDLVHRRRWNGTTRWECEKYLCDPSGVDFPLVEGQGASPEEAFADMMGELRTTVNNLQQELKLMAEAVSIQGLEPYQCYFCGERSPEPLKDEMCTNCWVQYYVENKVPKHRKEELPCVPATITRSKSAHQSPASATPVAAAPPSSCPASSTSPSTTSVAASPSASARDASPPPESVTGTAKSR